MEEVRIPGVAHQRIKDVGEDSVDQRILLVQNASHVDVLVHEQGVGSHIVELYSGVEDTVPPVEVVK